MIKKTTIAKFKNGDYAGEYDWKGGIPLSVGEVMSVNLSSGTQLQYKLVDKIITLTENEDDQDVQVKYYFELA